MTLLQCSSCACWYWYHSG